MLFRSNTVYVRYRDAAHILSPCYSDSILHDDIPPTNESIVIDGGAAETNSTSVNLSLSALDASEMYITNTAGCTGGGQWENYSTTKGWTLGQTNSTATVYVKYRDDIGNETSCVSDSIIHDNLPPAGGAITINSGAAYTNSTSVNLTLAATSVSQMFVTNTSGCSGGGVWENYSSSKSWTLAIGRAHV